MPDPGFDNDQASHLFDSATVMVGVCLAVIGVLNIDPRFEGVSQVGDFLLSLDAVFFLLSSLFAYFYMRNGTPRRLARLKALAEGMFIAGMVLTVFICIMMAYEFL